MSSAQIDDLMAQYQRLSPEEQRELRRRLDQQTANGCAAGAMTEDEFEDLLVSKGMISSIPGRDGARTTPPSLVKVSGPPLSETIIAERR